MENEKLVFYPNILNSVLETNGFTLKRKFFVLFADISGFTQISESMMSGGFEGAERIRDILNIHFNFFSKTIYSGGGDILQYSGDAILSVFQTFESAESSMKEIIDFTRKSGVLSIRGGISFGEIDFNVFEFNGGYLLLSEGKCIDEAMRAEQKSDIMSYSVATDERKPLPSVKIEDKPEIPPDRSVFKVFESCNLEYGSFAFASILFIFVHREDVKFILKLAEGKLYANKIERYPEGIRIFLLAGVLESGSNPVETMLEFVSEIESSSIRERVSGGFTSGYIFNGFTGSKERCEYNLIGKSINRAARIASGAASGEILFDKEILEETSSVSGDFARSENLRGIGIVNLYKLREYRKHSVPLYLPLFGRNLEMQILDKLLSEKNSVSVTGESGSGKTHFVSSYVYERNASAIYLNISDSDTLSDYSLLGILKIDFNEEDSLESAYVKFSNYMFKQNEKKLLVIDNVEKLDVKSSEIVRRYMKNSVGVKAILISSSGRGDIHLASFDRNGISGLIETRTGIQPSPLLSDTLFRKTNGNPYFILAFFKSLVSEEQIEMNYLGEWDINEDRQVISSDISTTVQMVFSSLSPLERNILKVASVFDFGCPEEILLHILREKDFEFASKSIMDLVQKNILQKRERKVSFVNDVVREHVYRSVLLKEKESLHRMAAKNLLKKKDFLEAGRHLYLSGEKEESGLLLKNYVSLLEEGKNSLALYYAQILLTIEKSPNVLLDTVSLLLKEGRYPEAEKIFTSESYILNSDQEILLRMKLLSFKGVKNDLIEYVISALRRTENEETEFLLLDECAYAMAITGHASALEFAQKALRLFEKHKDENSKKIKLGGTFRQLGDYDTAERIYKTLHLRALENGDEIDAYSALSEMVEMMPQGRFSTEYGLEINEKLLSLLLKKDRKREVLKALKSIAMKLRDAGEYDRAVKYGQRAIDLARILKDSAAETVMLSQLGRMAFNRGNMKESLKLFEEAKIIAERNNFILLLESIYGNMGVLMHAEGDYKEAYALYEKALEISLKVKHSDTRFIWILNLALLQVETKEIESAAFYLSMARDELVKSNIPERWLDVEQIALNCAFLQGDYNLCLEKGELVLPEAEKRGETELYFEALPYYAGALILTGDSKGQKLLDKAKAWASEKNCDNVLKNIAEVGRALNPPE